MAMTVEYPQKNNTIHKNIKVNNGKIMIPLLYFTNTAAAFIN